MEQRETISEVQKIKKEQLSPFICGLCHSSFTQILNFYRHFKIHSDRVGWDNFHICEIVEFEDSDRDANMFDIQTFACSRCAMSFPTICLLHEHIKEHEPNGSYTLDLKNKTGYPSSRQYPRVDLSKDVITSNSLSSSDVVNARKRRPLSSAITCKNTRSKGRPTSSAVLSNSSQGRGRPSDSTISSNSIRGKGLPPSSTISFTSVHKKGRPKKIRRGRPAMLDINRKKRKEEPPKSDVDKPRRRGRSCKSNGDTITRDLEQSVTKKQLVTSTLCETERPGQSTSKNKTFTSSTVSSISGQSPDNLSTPVCVVSKPSEEGLEMTQADVDEVSDDENADVYIDNSQVEEYDDMEEEEGGDDDTSEVADLECNSIEDKERNDKETAEDLTVSTNENIETNVKVEAAEGTAGTSLEGGDGKRKYSFRRNLNVDLDEERELRASSMKVNFRGKKKFVFCEVCGVKKEQYLLLNHVDKVHGDVELSKEFKTQLTRLRIAAEERRRKYPKQKKVSKYVEEHLSDEDYTPSDEADLKCSDDEYTPKMEKSDRKSALKRFRHGPKKSYYECDICHMLVISYKVTRHMDFHKTKMGRQMLSPENMVKCEDCSRTFMKSHIDKHKCFPLTPVDETKKIIKKEQNDTDDKEGVTKPKRLKGGGFLPCHVCGILVKRYDIKKHLLGHSDVRPFSCSECPKKFKLANILKKHMQDSHGERRYRCDQCPKAFTNNALLKGHYMLHTDERPFPCEVCGKRFRRMSQLKNHLLTHGGTPARFSCPECDKKFMRRSNLNAHVKDVHLCIRNWLCSWPQCSKHFKSSQVLRRHMLIHTGEKPEKCAHCDAAFTQRTELKLHLKKKHNIDQLPPPNRANPYAGVPPHVIEQPTVAGEETGVQQGTPKMKTVLFTSMRSQLDMQAVSQLTTLPKPQHGPQLGTSNANNVSEPVRMETSCKLQQTQYSNVKPEPSASEAYVVSAPLRMETSSTLQQPTNSSIELGTINANIETAPVRMETSFPLQLPMFNNVSPKLGTSTAGVDHLEFDKASDIQGTVSLPVSDPYPYDIVKTELVSSAMGETCNLTSDTVLTPMTPVISYTDLLN